MVENKIMISWLEYFKFSKENKRLHYFCSTLFCTNCGISISGYILKGELVTEQKCLNCGCQTLKNKKVK